MSSQSADKQAAHSTRPSGKDGSALVASSLKLILVAALLFTAWSAVRLEPWSQPAQATVSSQTSTPWTNVNPVGVNTFLAGEVEVWKRERTIEMVAEAGAGWIRQGFPWNEIEPQKGEHWDSRYQQDAWAKFDNIVDLAEQHGVRIIARLDQTPEWARPAGTDAATPPSDYEDYGDFVYDFVSRYRGRVSFIQIWNEPNLAREWGGNIEPEGYALLLEIAARRAREADPDIVILSAPMAMTTENSARALDEFTYWQALYDLGAAEWFDIMSANVYGLSNPFDSPPNVEVLNTRRVELLRDLAVRNGDGNKAIWFNEYGWNAAPAHFPSEKLIWSRVDESQQAEWTAAGFDFARDNWHWFGVANIWYFRHVGNISPDEADYYFRMVDVEFTPRAVYLAVQNQSRERSTAMPGTHGVLTAPVTSFGSWGIEKDTNYRDGFAISGESGSALQVRFRGSALDLHVPPHSSHGTLTITVQGGESTQESDSRRYLVDVPDTGGYVRVTADALEHPQSAKAGIHTVVVTVNDSSRLLVDTVRVRYERSYTNLLAGMAIAGAAGAGVAGSSHRNNRTV